MRSRDPEVRSSLRARVAVAAAVGAAFVGLVAAGAAAFFVEELGVAAQDQRLTDAASLMQRELDTEGGDTRQHVESEAAEIAPIGLRMALFEHGVRIAGAQDVPAPAHEGCASRDSAAGRWRTCAVGAPARRIAVSTHREESGRRGVLLLAVGAAALLAALVSALASGALAGWALAPLTALRTRLETISDTPGDADLGEPSGSAEVEALRETIRGLLKRLGEAIERSRGFAASAAHELRTPLSTMMAELELAAEESPQLEGSLTRVRRTVGRLSVLVERLLLIATGSAHALVTEAVALEDVVREVVAARPEGDRARISVTVEASGMVRGDEALLRIVVDNLVDNALKFSGDASVVIVVSETNQEVCLAVRDEGPGIDPGDVERLLRPFERGHAAVPPGHGLGLSIVAHAVRLHRGRMQVISRAPGVELRVTLAAWTASPPSV